MGTSYFLLLITGNMAERPNFKAPAHGLSVSMHLLNQPWKMGGSGVKPGGGDANMLERVRITTSFYFLGPISKWGATIVHRFLRFLWSGGSQTGVISSFRGHLAVSGDIFGCYNWGRWGYWHRVGVGQGILPYVLQHTRHFSLTQNGLIPRVNGGEVEQLSTELREGNFSACLMPFPYNVRTEGSQAPALSLHRWDGEQMITVQGCRQPGAKTPSQPRASLLHSVLCPMPARPPRHRMGVGKPETFQLGSASRQPCGLGCFLNSALLHVSFLLLSYRD